MDILLLAVCLVPLWMGWDAGNHLLQGDNVVPRLLAVLFPWTVMSALVSAYRGGFFLFPVWLSLVCGVAALSLVLLWWYQGGDGLVAGLLTAGIVVDLLPRSMVLTSLALGSQALPGKGWEAFAEMTLRLASAAPVFFLAGMMGLYFHMRDHVGLPDEVDNQPGDDVVDVSQESEGTDSSSETVVDSSSPGAARQSNSVV
jgi:hypothetical protein